MPGAPPAPTLTVGGDKQIDVEVTAPADGGAPITGYDTEFRESGIDRWGILGGTMPKPSMSLRGLKPGQKYEVRVRAVNRRGAGPWSDFASATTTDSATLPGAPPAPTLTVGGDKQIDVEVTAPADGGAPITGYDFRIRESGIDRWGILGGTMPKPSVSLRGLKPGQKYEVRVRAVNRRGAGPWSDFASATTTDSATLPGAPPAPTLTVGGDKQIDVEVTAPADGGAPITGYDTEFREEGIIRWGTPGGVVPRRTRNLRGLKPGQKYEVRVRAVNRRGAGPWSDFASATTTDSATLPGAPPAPTLTVGGDKQIDVEVTAPADGGAPITGYDTEFRESGIDRWGILGGTMPKPSVSLRGLKPGQKYEVRVRAVNRRGAGPWSDFASATTTDSATLPGAPPAPTLTVGGDKQIDVEVTAPADGGAPITGYDTEFREEGIIRWGTPGGAVPRTDEEPPRSEARPKVRGEGAGGEQKGRRPLVGFRQRHDHGLGHVAREARGPDPHGRW